LRCSLRMFHHWVVTETPLLHDLCTLRYFWLLVDVFDHFDVTGRRSSSWLCWQWPTVTPTVKLSRCQLHRQATAGRPSASLQCVHIIHLVSERYGSCHHSNCCDRRSDIFQRRSVGLKVPIKEVRIALFFDRKSYFPKKCWNANYPLMHIVLEFQVNRCSFHRGEAATSIGY